MFNEKHFRVALAKKETSQIALAKKVGVDPSYLSRIVRGWAEPKTKIKHRIAKSLQVNVDELFPNSESEINTNR